MTESERYMSILRSAMRVLGMQHRELAKKLGWNPSYLSRLFNGVIDLKVDHLPQLVKGVGLEMQEFLRLAYPESSVPLSRAADSLRGVFPHVALSQPTAAQSDSVPAPEVKRTITISEDELEKKIEEKLENAVRKALLNVLSGRG
jgi:transcriptional regulator with XRE-family HTH domain